eukprot:2771462-Alexandrium_andersonii.AAC.1
MGLEDGWAKLHSVQADALVNHPDDYSAWLAKGTSRLGKPNPDLLRWLEVDGLIPQAGPGVPHLRRGRLQDR